MKYIKFWIALSIAAAGLFFLFEMANAATSGGNEAATGCEAIRIEVEATLQTATNATAPGSVSGSTDERILRARQGALTSEYKTDYGLRMITNNPECFSPANVAQAQSNLYRLTH